MKTILQSASLCSLAVLLAACGGSSTDSNTQQTKSVALGGTVVGTAQQGAKLAPAEYTDLVQRIYLTFFGRPADANGLVFWSKSFSDNDMPTTISGLISAYAANGPARSLVDAFANSAEANALYSGGSNSSFINSVYLNVLNRNADADGRTFWTGFVDRGELTRAQAALWILGGAQNDDSIVVAKKVQAATFFTAALDTPAEIQGYSGSAPNQAARDLLLTIKATSDMDALKADLLTLAAALASQPESPTVKQYVGFNYLQTMNNAPAYAASYSYASAGIVIGLNGQVTYGVTPQTIGWARVGGMGPVLSYDLPVTANFSLAGTGVVPTLTMLCRPLTVGATSSTLQNNKSTDVLVARAAKQLVDASQLAGQTLSVFHENCATDAGAASLSFDSAGNASYTSSGVTLNLPAASVTAVLNGGQIIETSSQLNMTFAAYSYPRADGSTGYAVVQLQRIAGQTVLAGGSLAVWSQE